MKIILLLIMAFGLTVSLAFNAYLLNDITAVWVELIEIHELLLQIFEYLQMKPGTSV